MSAEGSAQILTFVLYQIRDDKTHLGMVVPKHLVTSVGSPPKMVF